MPKRIPISLRITEETQKNVTILMDTLVERLGFDVTMTDAFEYAIRQTVNQIDALLPDTKNLTLKPAAQANAANTASERKSRAKKPAAPATAQESQESTEFDYTLDAYDHSDEISISVHTLDINPRTRTRDVYIVIGEVLKEDKIPWKGIPYQYLHEVYKQKLIERYTQGAAYPTPYEEFVELLKNSMSEINTLCKDTWRPGTITSETHMTAVNESAKKYELDRWAQVPEGYEFEGLVR